MKSSPNPVMRKPITSVTASYNTSRKLRRTTPVTIP